MTPQFFSEQASYLLAAGVLIALLAISLTYLFVRRKLSQQRETLRLERQRWRLLVAANQDAIFDVDLRNGGLFFSPQWFEQIGYLPGELAPSNDKWLQRIHPDDKARVEAYLADYLEHRAPTYDVEYRLRHRDGHWCWIHARAQAEWDKNGKAVRLVASHADITHRKRSESALQASEARFRTFLDHNPAITCIKDEDGRLLYANRKLFEQGRDIADMLGKTDAELWPAEVAAEFRASDLAVLNSEATADYLDTITLPDESVRHYQATKFMFRDAGGQKFLGCMALDVTERRRAEAALSQSEERHRELFERNPLPAWIYHTETFKIQAVNEAAIAHYGWSREEFLALTVMDIRLPEEAEALEAALDKLLGQRASTGPWHHRLKDGSMIWVEIAIQDLRSTAAPLRLTLVNDISARMEAEMALKSAYDELEVLVARRTSELRQNKLRWRALVEATPQIVFATGPMGEPDYMSPRAAEYTGLPMSELIGGKWASYLHRYDRPQAIAAWRASLQSGSPFEVESRIRSAAGDYRWFKTVSRPVLNEDGEITRWIGTATDIDDQKRSEEALEAAVARRTLELAEARDRAEAATRAKTQFLAAMSHEIRTPMNGVIGMANIMLDTEMTSQQRCYMDTIRSSGEALLTVINDILDLSKIEAGRLELERTQFDLSTLLEEAIEVVATQATAKNLQMHSLADDKVPFDLVGDPTRLRQIVLNLLGNAVKFTPEGSVSISVTREANQNQMIVLRFAIRDTGVGLTAKQQENLFQAFQQADLSTARRFGGTGLGLAISKRLVEMMGSTMGVHSQIGEGSTFWFNVCLETSPVFSNLDCFAGKHVAMVANQSAVTSRLCSYLEAVGMRVSHYKRIPQTKHTRFDLLLVDSAALTQPAIAIQAWPCDLAPILILGTQADFGSSAIKGHSDISFVPKPVRRLPLLRAIEAALTGILNEQAADLGQSSASHRVEVLLAEDNKVNQLVARIMLEKMGCQVDMAENGLEACTALQHKAYDLVLMDCQMPTMSGFEATERIRGLETSGRRTPIIALTAGVLKEERDRCYASGMDDFICKPISQKDLDSVLEKWAAVRADRVA
jgi:PAS domain S-box-containing protein